MSRQLQERISANVHTLSPQLRAASAYMLKHPDEVASRSLRYVAKSAQLTPPTFSRLARALGFDSYEELRDLCRAHLKRQRLSFAEKARALQDESLNDFRQATFIVRQAEAVTSNINSMLENIDLEELEAVVEKLSKARRVLLVGTMSSRPFVDYMAYMAALAFDNWQVFGNGAQSMAAAVAGLDSRDAVVVVSKSPYALRSVQMARRARATGATVIAITDTVMSPLAQPAHRVLVAPTDSPQFFVSHVATLTLIESIISLVVARGGEASRQRIAAIEAASRRMGEYWPVPKSSLSQQKGRQRKSKPLM